MQNFTNDIPAAQNLGSEEDPLSLVNMFPKTPLPKKRHAKGYLRYKIIAGIRYWYYCRTVHTRSGESKQKCEYIGSADAIYKMKKATKDGVK